MEIKRKRDSLWKENVHQAVEIIRAHRMRSGLLILGVAIGITTILMIVTVLSGLSRKIYHDLASANRPYIYLTKFDMIVSGDAADEQAKRKSFTREQADEARRAVSRSRHGGVHGGIRRRSSSRAIGAEKTPPTGDHRLRQGTHRDLHPADRSRTFHQR